MIQTNNQTKSDKRKSVVDGNNNMTTLQAPNTEQGQMAEPYNMFAGRQRTQNSYRAPWQQNTDTTQPHSTGWPALDKANAESQAIATQQSHYKAPDMPMVTDTQSSPLPVNWNNVVPQYTPNMTGQQQPSAQGNRDSVPPQLTQEELSAQLGKQIATTPEDNTTFHKDDNQRDGGFNQWFKKVMVPKTEEDYSKDNEMKKRILFLGETLRQMGNLYATTRWAPNQKFNSPVLDQEQQYQTDKARSQNEAYRQAMAQMQQDKIDMDRANNEFNQQMRINEYGLKAKDDARKDKEFALNAAKSAEDMAYKQALTRGANADAGKKEAEGKYAEQLAKGKLSLQSAQIAATRAREVASRAAAAASTARARKTYQEIAKGVGKAGKEETYHGANGYVLHYPKGSMTQTKINDLFKQCKNVGMRVPPKVKYDRLTGMKTGEAAYTDKEKLDLVSDFMATERGQKVVVDGNPGFYLTRKAATHTSSLFNKKKKK